MRRIELKKDKIAEIVESYLAGHTFKEVSVIVDRTPYLVRRVLQDSGVAIRPSKCRPRRGLSHIQGERLAEASAMYEAGEPLSAIARAIKTSLVGLNTALKAAGVPRRAHLIQKLDGSLVVSRYLAGENMLAISKSLKVGVIRVKDVLKEADIPLRMHLIQELDSSRVVGKYLAGEGMKGISESLKVGVARIREVLKEEGVPIKRSGGSLASRGVSCIRRDEILAGYLAGAEVSSLAKLLGISAHGVRVALKASGVALRRRVDIDKAEVLKRYMGGENGPALSKHFKVSAHYIYQIIRESGHVIGSPDHPRQAT